MMRPDEAEALIDRNPSNKDILFPFGGGEDVNQKPDFRHLAG
jgi:hypothetical protein